MNRVCLLAGTFGCAIWRTTERLGLSSNITVSAMELDGYLVIYLQLLLPAGPNGLLKILGAGAGL